MFGQLAKARLHTAMLLSKMRKHRDALKYIDQVLTMCRSLRCTACDRMVHLRFRLGMQVLAMVDEGLLEIGGVTTQKLTLITVAYHNKAVALLLIGQPQNACVAMQSVRRLAKLCAGTCAVFNDDFELTQHAVLRALTLTPEVKTLMRGMAPKLVLEKLTEDLFSE